MKKTLLTLMASLLLGGAAVAQHYTAPNAHSKSSNTPIVAAVTVDGAAAATGAELAVYVDDELRGLATTAQLVDGKFWVQVYYDTEKPSDTDPTTNVPNIEDLTFKLWDPTGEGTELTDYTLTYTDNGTTLTALTTQEEGWGTPGNPVAIDFAATQMQSMTLDAGWTWWSTPIEMEGVDGLAMLENSLGHNGLYIESQIGGVENYYSSLGYDYWWGDIEELNNEEGYKLMTTSSCPIAIRGRYANPENHPIMIQPNWNWIGYPCRTAQLLSNADFQPSDNDIIQSQNDGSTYYDGYGWWPDFTMVPGEGYLYYSYASTEKEMRFTNNTRGTVKHEDRERFWSNDVHAFKDNIFIIANAYLDEEEIRDDKMEIGAFVNGENRGSAKLMYFEPLDRYFTSFTISGQKDDLIEFRLVDTRNGIENTECDTYFTFKPFTTLGNLNSPVELRFGTSKKVALNLYPNPIERNQSFSVNLPLGEKALEITIVNELGEIVSQQQGMIDSSSVSSLPNSGLFIVKVVCESGKVFYSKLIVK